MIQRIFDNFLFVLKKSIQFDGRADRSEYWWFFAAAAAISAVFYVVDAAIGIPFFGTVFLLAMLIPSLSVTIRRLHDSDRSGWWLLICLVPILGVFAVLAMMVVPGSVQANRFGQQSKSPVSGMVSNLSQSTASQ